jgi:exonuclease III
VNKNFIDKVIDIEYMTNIMWSDHCPVKLIIND